MPNKVMDKNEFKRELKRLYSNCASPVIQINKGKFKRISMYLHPRRNEIIEVNEDLDEVRLALVYKDTTNAAQRNTKVCRTIEEFKKAVF